MWIGETPPFGRGETAGNTTLTDLAQYEGKEYVCEDVNWGSSNSVKPVRTNRLVRTRIVRNHSGIALLPRRLLAYELTAGADFGQRVDGMPAVNAGPVAGVVDEYLPAAGVADKDLFHMVIEGPSETLTSLAVEGLDILVGDFLVSATAATSQATTAGHVVSGLVATTTTHALNNALNTFGRAMSAKTTQNTNAALLVDVHTRWS